MQETIVAQIDADVRKSAPHGIEENQVAGLEFTFIVDFITDLALLLGCSWQQLTQRVPENHLYETATIKPDIRVGTAPSIVDPDKFQALEDQILRAIGVDIEQGDVFAKHGRLFGRLGNTNAAQGKSGD
jgi:hypothetical protein